MMKKTFLLLIMLCSFSALADPVYWIDVRTAAEFNTGHLAGAVNIPHGEIANEIAGLTQDKNAEIYLYCRSGGRAGKALNALEKLGYTQVVNEGGYDDVVEKMKKVEAKPSYNGY
jgi:phage shock protein E